MSTHSCSSSTVTTTDSSGLSENISHLSVPGYEIMEQNTFLCLMPQNSEHKRSRSCQPKITTRPRILTASQDTYAHLSEELAQHVGYDLGMTVMLHDVRSDMEAMDILDLASELELINDVTYVYLPVQGWAAERSKRRRNKGYAFIHFSYVSSALLFMRQMENSPARRMRISEAKSQGVAENLRALLLTRARSGKVHFLIRLHDDFMNVSLQDLRSIIQVHSRRNLCPRCVMRRRVSHKPVSAILSR